jgi:transposase
MTNLSVTKPRPKRHRFSREFKASILAECLEPRASVSRIALENGLNANMVRRWIKEGQQTRKAPARAPRFVPVNLPAAPSAPGSQSVPDKPSTIRVEIPRAGGAVVIEWPAEQAHQCASLLRDLLG